MHVNLNEPFVHLYVVCGPAVGTEHREIKIKNFSYVETRLRSKNKTKNLFFRLTPFSFSYGIKIYDEIQEFRIRDRRIHYYNFFANNWRRELGKKLNRRRSEELTIRLEADTVSGSLKIFLDGKIVAYISDTTMKFRELLTVEKPGKEEKLEEWYTEALVNPYEFNRNLEVKRIPTSALSLRELAFRRCEKYLYIRNERERIVPPPFPCIPECVVLGCEIDFRYHPISFDIWSPYLRMDNLQSKGYFQRFPTFPH